ncbi:unnamed protein product [Arabidopsis lyrata]|uniref:F-box domain-containing protein n=1 Tax=Arabidopsis lyrata subsp. lyrata TaxID=81972 RepID=D7LXQ2_ARALL|nr:hypothetical protein ARALYDRAFT_909803 [Arabidopsis lyrata subsp. lyrata]CAH8271452.1 unnamed protein product [Arabidopsis lyrata]
MDEQEKNKEEIERTTSNDQQDPIPVDLILVILSRLPVKSIVRFLCVSKIWSSITTQSTLPSFINSFSSRPRRLLLTFLKKKKRFVFSFPQNQNHDRSYYPVYSYQVTNTNYSWSCNTSSESVQGLIVLKGSIVWNPTINKFLPLPKPNRKLRGNGWSFLGYDPLEGKHKVLRLYSKQHGVLTLGAQESWRIFSQDLPSHFCAGYFGCVNGILYYKAFFGVGGECCLMSFDVRSEKFNPINFPEGSSHFYMIVPYEGRLALVYTTYLPNIYVGLWILEDADGHEWTYKSFSVPPSTRGWNNSNLELKGVTDAGEFIFTPRALTNSFYVLYFDPRSNSIREDLFEGIFGDEFRCRYGIGNYDSLHSQTFNIDVFPNHIETFVSLKS